MKMKHLIVEGYCDGEREKEESHPCNNTYQLGIQCFICPRFSYCQCPNEIALSNDKGIVEKLDDFAGFGGDMVPIQNEKYDTYVDIWKNICRKKIEEAYCEYMDFMEMDKQE